MKRLSIILLTLSVLTASCVKKAQEDFIPVDQVSIARTAERLSVGETIQLTAGVTPENASVQTIRWSSSAPAVARISEDGTVTAVAEGTAIISAAAGGKTASISVTVVGGSTAPAVIPVEDIVIRQGLVTIEEGGQLQLEVEIHPGDDIHPCLLDLRALQIEQRRVFQEDIGLRRLHRAAIIEGDGRRFVLLEHRQHRRPFLSSGAKGHHRCDEETNQSVHRRQFFKNILRRPAQNVHIPSQHAMSLRT